MKQSDSSLNYQTQIKSLILDHCNLYKELHHVQGSERVFEGFSLTNI